MKLGEIALARSGDKGSSVNIGVIARKEENYSLLVQYLTEEVVKNYFSLERVVRYEVPNLFALNFVLEDALDGGGSLSLKTDAQGKAMGQKLLQMEIKGE